MNNYDAKKCITDVMERFIKVVAIRLPDDVSKKLQEISEIENSEMQKALYGAYFENLEKAKMLERPCCQDTGLMHFYIRAGTEFPYLNVLEEALQKATHNATFSIPLRQNVVNFFEERNTGDNTGERIPWINWELVPNNSDLEICTYFAGGGCCLPGQAKVFTPSQGYAAIIPFVFEAVANLGVNACPPLIVGVGLGHNVENAALLSKKAYLRPLGTHHKHPRGKDLENMITEGLNKLGFGAQGLRGNTAVMEVHIESSARHTATIAAAVNVACYAHRRGVIKFRRDLTYELLTYEGVSL